VIIIQPPAVTASEILPAFRVPAAYTLSAIPAAQAGTLIGDLTVILAFGTGASAPTEPGALMVSVDSDAGIRKGRLAYRIATADGVVSFGTWTGCSSWAVMTFIGGTFDATTPFDDGGAGYFFTSEPDTSIAYPALAAAPNSACLAFWSAYSNLGPVEYGLVASSDSRWLRSTVSSYSRGATSARASFAGETVAHASGSAAQTLACSGYVVGFT
jgi:hypothetical protein